MKDIDLTSTAFRSDSALPDRYTCAGEVFSAELNLAETELIGLYGRG